MKLCWSRRALRDLQRLADRIAADKPLAATEFVDSLIARLALLVDQPLMGRQGALEDTRELVLHKHYLITYRLRGDEVQLLQLWHLAQDRPSVLKSKKP